MQISIIATRGHSEKERRR